MNALCSLARARHLGFEVAVFVFDVSIVLLRIDSISVLRESKAPLDTFVVMIQSFD